MQLFGPIQDLFQRVAAYQPAVVVTEFIVIWIVVYAIVRFVQGTRAAGALKGLLVLLVGMLVISRILGGTDTFQRLSLLYDRFLALVAVGLIVIFQPELRRALVRLGETPFFRGTRSDIDFVVDEIVEACAYLSKARFGALVAIERQVGLDDAVEGGTVLNAEVSSRLLQSIFFPGGALHDLGVIVRGRRVYSANVQFPLAEPTDMPDAKLGSRHRAAVGLTKECDALVVVVSEETGAIRIAERGRLSGPMTHEELTEQLTKRLEISLRQRPREAAPSEEFSSETAEMLDGSAGVAGEGTQVNSVRDDRVA
ncbi:MAG: TIGR00159 family protein [Phycisphaerales bacterium]|nr:TIGR00159 family protein [Phycisphaerales bacterium]